MGLLAQSSLIPGFASLLLLLTTSLTESSCKEMLAETLGQKGKFCSIGQGTNVINRSNQVVGLHKDLQWMRDYL